MKVVTFSRAVLWPEDYIGAISNRIHVAVFCTEKWEPPSYISLQNCEHQTERYNADKAD